MLSGNRLLHGLESPILPFRNNAAHCSAVRRCIMKGVEFIIVIVVGLLAGISLVVFVDILVGRDVPVFIWNGAASSQILDYGTTAAHVKQPKKVELDDAWIRRLAFRKQRTNWACQHYGSGARTPLNPPSSEELQYIWVSDDLQLVYCEVPKAASSLWKMLILKAKGYPIKSLKSVHMLDFPRNLRRLDTYSSSEIENILNHYLKFLILRHPADRLVSAYRDKIKFWKPQNPRALSRVGNYVNQLKGLSPFYPTDIPEDDTQLYHYLKRKINSGAELWDTMTSLRPSNVTFRDFIRYVADHPDAPDKHWTPIHRQCHPCYINYDIISYYETMKEDGDNILKLVQHDTDLHIKEKTQSSCPKCLRTSKMFERIYEPEMGKIKQMYQLDWAMALGETDFLKSP